MYVSLVGGNRSSLQVKYRFKGSNFPRNLLTDEEEPYSPWKMNQNFPNLVMIAEPLIH